MYTSMQCSWNVKTRDRETINSIRLFFDPLKDIKEDFPPSQTALHYFQFACLSVCPFISGVIRSSLRFSRLQRFKCRSKTGEANHECIWISLISCMCMNVISSGFRLSCRTVFIGIFILILHAFDTFQQMFLCPN